MDRNLPNIILIKVQRIRRIKAFLSIFGILLFQISLALFNAKTIYAASMNTMDQDLSNADASFWGESAVDKSGIVSIVGDVNGDGYDDFIIGAYQDDDGGTDAGQTYLILGKADGWAMDTDLSAADASFIGEDAGDNSGYSVSGAGDVNADGYDDFLIGASGDEDGGTNAGQTYLILGKTDGWAMDTDLSASDASFIGEDATDFTGVSVSGAGDVNADGYDDFLIGGHGDEDGGGVAAGQTYLILGKAEGWAMDTDLSLADASFWGEDADDSSGISVSGVGDVNGDVYDDFLIAAYGDEEGGAYAGQTYLILGKADGWAMDTDLSVSDASFRGEHTLDYSGGSVSGAGDVNGDGYDDFIIGAYSDSDSYTDAGQTYLILGKAEGWTMDTALSLADASFWGEHSRDYSGKSVSGAGDINGDGYDDFLIGAYGNDDGGSEAGQTYLIFGKADGWAMDTDLSLADASFWGEYEDAASGRSVSGAGDVNGDGAPDFLIGAWGGWSGDLSAGQTYLIFGVVPDSDAPSISLAALSPDPNSDSTPSLTGTATDAVGTVSSVEYTMDCTSGDCSSASWTTCTADDTTFDEASEAFTCTISSALSDGEHTIYVRATDSNSNTTASGSESSDTFTIDSTASSLTLDTPTSSYSTDGARTLTGTATDATTTVSSVEYQVDSTSGTWTTCAADDGAFDEASETFACSITSLSDGTHTIYVRSTDAAGNVVASASYSTDGVIVDSTRPLKSSSTGSNRSNPVDFEVVKISGDKIEDGTTTDDKGNKIGKTQTTDQKPKITFERSSDATSGVDKYEIRLTNTNKGLSTKKGSDYKWIEGIPHSGDNGQTRERDGVEIKYVGDYIKINPVGNKYKLEDGIYYMFIRVYDKAGNKTDSEEIKIEVDESGNYGKVEGASTKNEGQDTNGTTPSNSNTSGTLASNANGTSSNPSADGSVEGVYTTPVNAGPVGEDEDEDEDASAPVVSEKPATTSTLDINREINEDNLLNVKKVETPKTETPTQPQKPWWKRLLGL